MSLYAEAANAILSHVAARQTELDAAAQSARADHLAALRLDLRSARPTDDPLYPLLAHAAASVAVGREDGYPATTLSKDTMRLVLAAHKAGLIVRDDTGYLPLGPIRVYLDGSGVATCHDKWADDYAAYLAASNYRHTPQV